jgi:hypothetical protein
LKRVDAPRLLMESANSKRQAQCGDRGYLQAPPRYVPLKIIIIINPKQTG